MKRNACYPNTSGVPRVVIVGNSRAGKSTLEEQVIQDSVCESIQISGEEEGQTTLIPTDFFLNEALGGRTFLRVKFHSHGGEWKMDAVALQEAVIHTLLEMVEQGNTTGIAIGKLRELVQPLGRMDYIPPGTSHTDLKVMEWEHWERLLESIREEDGYDWVILDLGDCLEGLFSILDQCDRIYVPVKDDPVSASKLEQFLWVCESLGFRTGEHRLFQVTPPPEDLQRILQEDCEDTALYRYVERLLGDGDRTTSAGGV